MPPIGETLREARMRQNLDVADLEDRTKIRAKYLRALENEEWSALPGHTFVKTFLRTYAEQVGLDPHVLVEEYRMAHEGEEPELTPLAGPPAATRREPRRISRPAVARPPAPRWGPLAVLVVLALVAFVFVLGLFGEDNPTGDDPPEDRASRTDTGPRRPPPERRPAAPRRVTMRIAPVEPTYVCVDTGEGTDVLFEGTLGEARTFRNRRRLRVNLGLRSVDLSVNGAPVEIAESGDPVGYEVTPAGAEEIEGLRPCA